MFSLLSKVLFQLRANAPPLPCPGGAMRPPPVPMGLHPPGVIAGRPAPVTIESAPSIYKPGDPGTSAMALEPPRLTVYFNFVQFIVVS